MSSVIKDQSRIPALLNELEYIADHQIQIGVFAEEDSHLVMIANVHEFGCIITVTPRMRAYLHYMGLHLSPATHTITIPERSYIRATLDTKDNEISDMIRTQLTMVLKGQQTGQGALERIAIYVTALIQNYMTYLTSPPLHPFTIEQKGSSQPLIDIGRLRMSITWRIEKV